MRTTQPMSIVLPQDMAEMVKAKVASGEYATESDVILHGLQALVSHERSVDRWLFEDVAPAYDAHKAHPERAIPLAEAMARIKARAAG